MGIEPIANSLSPVESVGLTLLEDLIWAQERGILRPSCAQIFPSPKILDDGVKRKSWPHARAFPRSRGRFRIRGDSSGVLSFRNRNGHRLGVQQLWQLG